MTTRAIKRFGIVCKSALESQTENNGCVVHFMFVNINVYEKKKKLKIKY